MEKLGSALLAGQPAQARFAPASLAVMRVATKDMLAQRPALPVMEKDWTTTLSRSVGGMAAVQTYKYRRTTR